MNGGLLARSEGLRAIVDVLKRGCDLVAHAIVQRELRTEAVFILNVGA
jgi:hypothetical protein